MYIISHHSRTLDPPMVPISLWEKTNSSPHLIAPQTSSPISFHSPLTLATQPQWWSSSSSNMPSYHLPQGLCTWKTLLPKLYPTHHHSTQVSNLTSSEKPCQLAPCPLTLLYFSSGHLLLSKIILDVYLLICCLSPLSDYKPHRGRGLDLLTIWQTVGIQ